MARGLTYEKTATSTILVLLVLLEAALVMEQVEGAPVQQRNEILAGTEFLSVFINGAMAPVAPPSPRRRGYRRGGGGGGTLQSTADNVPAESRQMSEASIYRISRAPSSPRPFVTRSGHRDDTVPKLYPINQRTNDAREETTTLSGEMANSGEQNSRESPKQQSRQTQKIPHQTRYSEKISTTLNRDAIARSNITNDATVGKNRSVGKSVNQKVIGISVTSTIESTPYRVRVEHHEVPEKLDVTTDKSIATTITTTILTTADTTTTTVTPVPAHLVTEELGNIVSESNRSEFSVDEGIPKTSWRNRSPVTGSSMIDGIGASSGSSLSSLTLAPSFSSQNQDQRHHRYRQSETPFTDSQETSTSLEPVEESYESVEVNSEPLEIHKELPEERLHQARKVGRHYDPGVYDQGPKLHRTTRIYSGKSSRSYGIEGTKNNYPRPEMNYGEPARVYSEPAKIYGEPAKVYSEPSKIYGEPAKIYGEPERIYGEPAKVYSEPARIYGEPAKVYGEPAKIYSEPSKIYGADGRPVVNKSQDHRNTEPREQNYEIDEAVSVGSNGNVHGPQIVTESSLKATSIKNSAASQDSADGHNKVGYVVEERNYRKYRVEERTPDGFIVGEYGVVSHDDGSLRGVRYTADGTIDPRLIYDALMKFLAL